MRKLFCSTPAAGTNTRICGNDISTAKQAVPDGASWLLLAVIPACFKLVPAKAGAGIYYGRYLNPHDGEPHMNEKFALPSSTLIGMLKDTRRRTLDLIADLSDEQLMGPQLDIVNPLLWEIGHVGFFFEIFVLGELEKTKALLEDADELYNSFLVDHDVRWELSLPSREETLAYMDRLMQILIGRIDGRDASAKETYLYLLGIFHEDMHGEAFTYTRQTLSFAEPQLTLDKNPTTIDQYSGQPSGGIEILGGKYQLGAAKDQSFIFDNEKWAHPIDMESFKIAKCPVTNGQFAEFVQAGGYARPEFWSYGGRMWLRKSNAKHPVYWVKQDNDWLRRHFDTFVPLEDFHPVIHVNWYEAEAFCNWAGRRLPTEAEWELAISGEPANEPASIGNHKRLFPWGEEPPTSEHANLDSCNLGCVDVRQYPKGDSAIGCRQMTGNVWEWTSSAFYPFPGFIVDHPYKEYSAPWFGHSKVLRGGCWATRSRLIRNTYRNFYLPHRRDVFAGFRTCATKED